MNSLIRRWLFLHPLRPQPLSGSGVVRDLINSLLLPGHETAASHPRAVPPQATMQARSSQTTPTSAASAALASAPLATAPQLAKMLLHLARGEEAGSHPQAGPAISNQPPPPQQQQQGQLDKVVTLKLVDKLVRGFATDPALHPPPPPPPYTIT